MDKTHNLISGEALTEALLQIVPKAKAINMISAFVTVPATNWLLETTSSNASVCIVGRFTPSDFLDGASSLDAIEDCLSKGVEVKALHNLHAKIYQIDETTIYTGSANMTGKGLALVDQINLEACTSVAPSPASLTFIENIIKNATPLDAEITSQMRDILENIDCNLDTKTDLQWPEDLLTKCTKLFVSDFPLCSPGFTCDEYELNPSLEFAIVSHNFSDFTKAKRMFKKTNAYKWLLSTVKNNQTDRDLSFGQISKVLHQELCDDPAPYRSDIKQLQANLYEYVKVYAKDELEIYIPGRKSQVIRLRNPE